MQLAMVGLGRMGANLVRRAMGAGHECVVFDLSKGAVEELVGEGAVGASSIADLASKLDGPRVVWVMVPAGLTGRVVNDVADHLDAGDIIIDGGNSYYRDDVDRAKELAERDIHFVDVGTSGGVFGLERGFCLMIGGETSVVEHLDPIFRALPPASRPPPAPRTPGRADHGRTRLPPLRSQRRRPHGQDGPQRHRVRHDGRLRRGLNVLAHADRGADSQQHDAETAPLRDPEYYQFDFDLAEVTEVWRRGSVVASWLLDLTAVALQEDPKLSNFSGHVSDSGEGRWTVQAAVDLGVPAHVLTASLFERFSSRGEAEYGDRILSAMRNQFGGHDEKVTP